MLEINDLLDHETDDEVPEKFVKLSANDLTYANFFQNYMLKNVPCLIQDAIDDWPAAKDFVTKDNEPNIEFLDELIGNDKDVQVPVSDCSVKYFNAQEKCSMTWKEYKNYWYSSRIDIKYLKDWHLARQCPHYKFYQTPSFFGSDWLNEYWNEIKTDDYKFVYLGPKGSWTPFHTDVYGSFSWSANIAGYKKWIFFPRGKEPKDVYDIQEILTDLETNADNKLKENNDFEYFVIVQGPREIIFVPSGWYHQVYNITDTLSINHNWFNATNLEFVWKQLKYELSRVQDEIKDCFEENDEEWKETCQKLLLANHGMNFTTFLELLMCIYTRRSNNTATFDGWTYGPRHLKCDMEKIRQIASKMINTSCKDMLAKDVDKAKHLISND